MVFIMIFVRTFYFIIDREKYLKYIVIRLRREKKMRVIKECVKSRLAYN